MHEADADSKARQAWSRIGPTKDESKYEQRVSISFIGNSSSRLMANVCSNLSFTFASCDLIMC